MPIPSIARLAFHIAQQVALLHGGELVPLPTDPEDGGGARLKLALPVRR